MLRDEVEKRHMSVRQLALELKMSHATVTRVLAGQPVDIETTVEICNWLGVSVADVYDADPSVRGVANRRAVLLTREPELNAVFTAALDEVDAGNMSSDDLRDIVEYATFKLEHYRDRRRNSPEAEGRRKTSEA